MGICPMNPEQQLISEKNTELKETMRTQLQELQLYGFAQYLLQQVDRIKSRHLFKLNILQDIDSMEQYGKTTLSKEARENIDVKLEEDLTNSCLILEDEADLLESRNTMTSDEAMDSFQVNMRQNQSLVAQINIIYSKEIKKEDYLESLKLFLKWGQIYQEHSYAGFLSPLYQGFCQFACIIPQQEFSSIVDQVCVFVQFMVTIVTDVYRLQRLSTSECGKLIKNENVYNLIMSLIFKRTKLKPFILSCIKHNEKNKISLFEKQIERYKHRLPHFFKISKKFTLYDSSLTQEEIKKQIEEKQIRPPYSQSLKLVSELCKDGAPITKLKTIVNISKEIIKDIQDYYHNQEAPDLDPDNLSSIVMYLLVRNGNFHIYEQLRIVQHFTTTNCMNCISGYYLNVFIASIQTILTLQQE